MDEFREFIAATSPSFHRRSFGKERILGCFPVKLNLQKKFRQHQIIIVKQYLLWILTRLCLRASHWATSTVHNRGEGMKKDLFRRRPEESISQQQCGWGFFLFDLVGLFVFCLFFFLCSGQKKNWVFFLSNSLFSLSVVSGVPHTNRSQTY